jgi:hypothetical protein
MERISCGHYAMSAGGPTMRKYRRPAICRAHWAPTDLSAEQRDRRRHQSNGETVGPIGPRPAKGAGGLNVAACFSRSATGPHSGIGRALVEQWEIAMRDEGATLLMTSSVSDETEPQAWHKKNGFRTPAAERRSVLHQ